MDPTRAEIQRNNEAARVWRQFGEELAQIQNFRDAEMVARGGPSGSQPGAKYYSNFRKLVNEGYVPSALTDLEEQQYIRLLTRFQNGGWPDVAKLLKDLGG